MCSHGEVRWLNVYNNQYGTGEVCINGIWVNMCSYGARPDTTTVAQTFCRQLMGEQSCKNNILLNRITFTMKTLYVVSFGISGGSVTGTKTLYSITCIGQTGVFTQDCSYNIIPGYSIRGCTIRSSMIIGCYESSSCEQGDVRLVDGDSTLEGRVEFCTQGLWGAISTSSWDATDAIVVCKQLGFPWKCEFHDQNIILNYSANCNSAVTIYIIYIFSKGALAITSNVFGRGNRRIIARNVGCSGAELQLDSCSNITVPLTSGTSYQTHTPAGVICQGINTLAPTECNLGDIRLVNGLREMEGRVEVCAFGYWAIVCDGNWNIAATRLSCKQLGLPNESMPHIIILY